MTEVCSDTEKDVCTARDLYLKESSFSIIACRMHNTNMDMRYVVLQVRGDSPEAKRQYSEGRFTHSMPCPCHTLTMPFFSRPRHSTAVEGRPVGYLPGFGFFRLQRGVPRSLLSEAYQSSSQRSIPTTVKCGISTLQNSRYVKLLD